MNPPVLRQVMLLRIIIMIAVNGFSRRNARKKIKVNCYHLECQDGKKRIFQKNHLLIKKFRHQHLPQLLHPLHAILMLHLPHLSLYCGLYSSSSGIGHPRLSNSLNSISFP